MFYSTQLCLRVFLKLFNISKTYLKPSVNHRFTHRVNARPCCVNCLNVLRKCIPKFKLESEMCVMKETNVGGRSKPLGWNIVMVECDMDEVCEQGPGQSTWFPHFGYFFFCKIN